LNVDERGIVFTRSGNWAEAEAIGELVMATKMWHAGRVLIGGILVTIAVLAHVLHGGGNYAILLIAVIGLAVAGSKYFGPFQDDMVRAYRIPFSKVQSLTYDQGKLTIVFVDGNWKQDTTTRELPEEAASWIMGMWEITRTH
jgi:hypothetical protein